MMPVQNIFLINNIDLKIFWEGIKVKIQQKELISILEIEFYSLSFLNLAAPLNFS